MGITKPLFLITGLRRKLLAAYSAFRMFGFLLFFSFSHLISTNGKIRIRGGQGRRNKNLVPPSQNG